MKRVCVGLCVRVVFARMRNFIHTHVRVRVSVMYVCVCVSCGTYKLQEHVSQCVLRMGIGLQTGLHCRQHLFVQLQDVLNI